MKRILGWFAGLMAFALLAMLLAYGAGFLKIEYGNADRRPVGNAWDVQSLGMRDDVNVLFVLTDTLRAHRLSAYGYERETSPTWEYMASSGLRFARHLSQSSWTKCSMASMWTGVYPQRTGVLKSSHGLSEDAITPAEIFFDAGFRTAGIWRNGWVSPNFGFGQGFEVYERPPGKAIPRSVRIENPHIKLEGTDSDAVNAAVEFLRVHGNERWFLYVHLMDVHQYLYDEKNALFGSDYSDIYDNSVRHTDEVLGMLLTHLVDEDLLQNTLVVLASDHGEAFGERGIEGHAREVYRETTEVPFVIGFPFRLESGVTIETRSRNVDIWPTVLDLLDLPAMPETDGRSLVPEIMAAITGRKQGEEVPTPAFAHLDRHWGKAQPEEDAPSIAVALGSYRYILREGATGKPNDPAELLFDAASDPEELLNVIEEEPERAQALRELARGYLDRPPASWGEDAPSVELDEAEAEQLRALGYAVP